MVASIFAFVSTAHVFRSYSETPLSARQVDADSPIVAVPVFVGLAGREVLHGQTRRFTAVRRRAPHACKHLLIHAKIRFP